MVGSLGTAMPSDWIRSDERSEISSVKGVSQLSLLWEVLGNCLNMLARVYLADLFPVFISLLWLKLLQ